MKRSIAKHITLKLFSSGNKLILLFSDDGKGFDVDEQIKNGSGSGLYNLKKRASLIEASIYLQSNAENRTDMRIELPHSS